jgi:RimJ/RimL family protein N-acetyltransferase
VNQRLEHRRAPERLSTERLTPRRPRSADAAAILPSYAGDPEATRLLTWPRHRSVEDTLSFIQWSDQVWGATPAGPYLILDREDQVLGTTGLDVETPWRAATGYVLRRDA